jgi:hypothetical protein
MGLFGFFLIMFEIGMVYVVDLLGCASEEAQREGAAQQILKAHKQYVVCDTKNYHLERSYNSTAAFAGTA